MIALDAMGGDYAPQVAVEGAISAAKKGIQIALFGDQEHLEKLLDFGDRHWRNLPISIVHCSQAVGMAEEPTKAVRKADASMVKAIQAVAAGECSAVVTAGNSGAALVAGTLFVDRIPGILRPALGNFVPTINSGSIFCIDLGATTECKPEYFEQFGVMGHVYVRQMRGIECPRIGLLSNGHEAYKGSLLVKQAYALLQENHAINFVGNIEARDLLDGHADVLVCDGFTGNVMLKVLQGGVRALFQVLKEAQRTSWRAKIALFLCRGPLRAIKEKTDYARVGGALLLGLKKPIVVSHGCSKAQAIEQALVFAHCMANEGLYERFAQEVALLVDARGKVPEQLSAMPDAPQERIFE